MRFKAKIAKQTAFYLVVGLVFSVSLFASASAQHINANPRRGQSSSPGQIREAALVDGSSGWALVGDKLFWTGDNGATWSDITPTAPSIAIDAVQFGSNLVGRAVVRENWPGPQEQLAFLSTSDGGHNWTSHPVSAATKTDLERYARSAELFFVNSNRGWMEIFYITGSSFSLAGLFTTSDGGNTWTRLPDLPIGGKLTFISEESGWLSGGAAGDEIYKTQDGGTTWQAQAFLRPPSVVAANDLHYNAPVFTDAKQGRFLLRYYNPASQQYGIVVYSTSDGGVSWGIQAVDSSLPHIDAISANGSEGAFMAISHSDRSITIRRYSTSSQTAVATTAELPPTVPFAVGVTNARFLGSSSGWLVVGGGHCETPKLHCSQYAGLLSTSDGVNRSTTLPHRVRV